MKVCTVDDATAQALECLMKQGNRILGLHWVGPGLLIIEYRPPTLWTRFLRWLDRVDDGR